jgi:hypothetical protein
LLSTASNLTYLIVALSIEHPEPAEKMPQRHANRVYSFVHERVHINLESKFDMKHEMVIVR